jgi:mRNA interferase HigB
MRVIHIRRLREFFGRSDRADAEGPLLAWHDDVSREDCDWASFHDVKATYGKASLVGECVVFNIGGNKYRLVCQINYRTHLVFVKKVMTHKEYDLGLWKSECGCDKPRSSAAKTGFGKQSARKTR